MLFVRKEVMRQKVRLTLLATQTDQSQGERIRYFEEEVACYHACLVAVLLDEA